MFLLWCFPHGSPPRRELHGPFVGVLSRGSLCPGKLRDSIPYVECLSWRKWPLWQRPLQQWAVSSPGVDGSTWWPMFVLQCGSVWEKDWWGGWFSNICMFFLWKAICAAFPAWKVLYQWSLIWRSIKEDQARTVYICKSWWWGEADCQRRNPSAHVPPAETSEVRLTGRKWPQPGCKVHCAARRCQGSVPALDLWKESIWSVDLQANTHSCHSMYFLLPPNGFWCSKGDRQVEVKNREANIWCEDFLWVFTAVLLILYTFRWAGVFTPQHTQTHHIEHWMQPFCVFIIYKV